MAAANEFLCGICDNELKRPTTLTCGHSFCLHCITDWAERQKVSNKQPTCGFGCENAIPKTTLAVNHLLEDILATNRELANVVAQRQAQLLLLTAQLQRPVFVAAARLEAALPAVPEAGYTLGAVIKRYFILSTAFLFQWIASLSRAGSASMGGALSVFLTLAIASYHAGGAFIGGALSGFLSVVIAVFRAVGGALTAWKTQMAGFSSAKCRKQNHRELSAMQEIVRPLTRKWQFWCTATVCLGCILAAIVTIVLDARVSIASPLLDVDSSDSDVSPVPLTRAEQLQENLCSESHKIFSTIAVTFAFSPTFRYLWTNDSTKKSHVEAAIWTTSCEHIYSLSRDVDVLARHLPKGKNTVARIWRDTVIPCAEGAGEYEVLGAPLQLALMCATLSVEYGSFDTSWGEILPSYVYHVMLASKLTGENSVDILGEFNSTLALHGAHITKLLHTLTRFVSINGAHAITYTLFDLVYVLLLDAEQVQKYSRHVQSSSDYRGVDELPRARIVDASIRLHAALMHDLLEIQDAGDRPSARLGGTIVALNGVIRCYARFDSACTGLVLSIVDRTLALLS